MQFEFATVRRLIFGSGKIALLPAIALEFGSRALLVTGSKPQRARGLLEELAQAGLEITVYSCPGEPTVDLVREGAAGAREHDIDLVIGFGGGSAIDAAKAIAIVATNSGEPLDYLELVGKGQPFQQEPLPFLAVPTTAGTGAEMTRNAVLGSPQHGLKASLRSTSMLARVALVDADLTLDLPCEITAYTGMDTLTQLLEAFVSNRANAIVDGFCREGLGRVRDSLGRVFESGQDVHARESMAYASVLSGLALANAGLGVVHGFAGPLGGMLSAPHGALCAAVVAHGSGANIRALRLRGALHPALHKYEEAARILTGNPRAQAEDIVAWLNDLTHALRISRLRDYGLKSDQIPELVEKAAKASSMKANPIPLTRAELTAVLENSA